MRPSFQRIQRLTTSLRYYLHRPVIEIPRVTNDPECSRLRRCCRAKKYSLHATTHDHPQPCVMACFAHSEPYNSISAINSRSSSVFTPNSVAFRSFDPGSAPATT
jgi:hypothetical protein